MKTIEYKTIVLEYETTDELADSDKELVKMAKEAANSAYAPYSNFYVGAAISLENGVTVTGNNQENIAYPSGLCAERVAIFSAYSKFPGIAFKTIAVTAKSKHTPVDSPITPCGACRQVLAEYERLQNKPLRIILTGESGKVLVFSQVEDILPFSFKTDILTK